MISGFPTDFENNFDYQTKADPDLTQTTKPLYFGQAKRGAAATDTIWIICKYTYSAAGLEISRQGATGAWTNRASLTYT